MCVYACGQDKGTLHRTLSVARGVLAERPHVSCCKLYIRQKEDEKVGNHFDAISGRKQHCIKVEHVCDCKTKFKNIIEM